MSDPGKPLYHIGVVAEMLLAGKPVLAIPLNLEQQQTARALEHLGAGQAASVREPYAVVPRLQGMVGGDAAEQCARGARRLAERYSCFDRGRQRLAMFERAEELLAMGDREPQAGHVEPAAELPAG